MKVYKSTHKSITAATAIGTTWYRVTSTQFSKFIKDREDNIFVKYVAEMHGFDALDIAQMFGSAIDQEEANLYLCVTDGQPITVGDNTDVDPETAFQYYTPEDLEPYIEDATEKILLQHISYQEFKMDLLEEEQNDAVIEALGSSDAPLKDVIEDYNEIW